MTTFMGILISLLFSVDAGICAYLFFRMFFYNYGKLPVLLSLPFALGFAVLSLYFVFRIS